MKLKCNQITQKILQNVFADLISRDLIQAHKVNFLFAEDPVRVMMISWMGNDPLNPPRDCSAIISPGIGHVIPSVAMAAQYPMRRVEYMVSIVMDSTVGVTMSTDTRAIPNITL